VPWLSFVGWHWVEKLGNELQLEAAPVIREEVVHIHNILIYYTVSGVATT